MVFSDNKLSSLHNETLQNIIHRLESNWHDNYLNCIDFWSEIKNKNKLVKVKNIKKGKKYINYKYMYNLFNYFMFSHVFAYLI